MKKTFYWLFAWILLLSVPCCSEQNKDDGEVLARINDYTLTQKEFEVHLVSDLELEQDFMLTKDARKQFLDQLIQKELLIQEAKRLRLDTRKKFIKAIERHWGATLIKDLMDLKGKEFLKRTYVTQEEIEARYKEMKKSNEKPPPLETIAKEIAQQLAEKKSREQLRKWTNSLRKSAKIEINEEYFSNN